MDLDLLSAWQYELPAELIASRPAAKRDDSRLMLVDRASQSISHHSIRELPDLLASGSRLVFNNTEVIPGRLFGERTETGGKWEGLFLDCLPDGQWKLIGQTRGRLAAGETLTIHPATPGDATDGEGASLTLKLNDRADHGAWLATPESDRPFLELLQQFGTLPLPPYIGRKVADESDKQRYQTVYASTPGAIAAPTAGLHFTPELLQSCGDRNIQTSEVTLHVGIGTFRPVNSERLSDHDMHSEWCHVPANAAEEIQSSKNAKNSIVAVGTTSVRTLEAAALAQAESAGILNQWSGDTKLFIRPGFEFRMVDQLLTNFHLPGSTLIVLVAALAGYELTMEAYRQAVAERYRFYSYGDAMLIR